MNIWNKIRSGRIKSKGNLCQGKYLKPSWFLKVKNRSSLCQKYLWYSEKTSHLICFEFCLKILMKHDYMYLTFKIACDFSFFTVLLYLCVCNCFSGRSRSPRSFWQQRRKGLWGSSRTYRSTRTTGDQRGNWRCRNPRYGVLWEGWWAGDMLMEDNSSKCKGLCTWGWHMDLYWLL